jgi:hypothetical protein
MTPALARGGLIANAFANPLRLLDQVIEEITDVVRHAVDHGKDLFEDVSDEIRSRYTEVGGKISNVLGKLFRNAGMQNPLLPRTMTTAATSLGIIGIRFVCIHESHCDSL